MRIMAVDYGDVRTGVAVSDVSATLAGDAWVLHEKNAQKVILTISSEAVSRGVSTIVVGYPKNMNGTVGPRAEKSEKFAENLKNQCNIEVLLWDERLTTMSANRILSETGTYGNKRKKNVDAVAATLILESFIKSRK